MRRFGAGWVFVVAVVTLAAAAQAQTGEQPEMTPEQMAEMEAYMKAATPGPQHQALAASVGTYDCQMKAWHAPGEPPMEETGTSMRSMILDGRVLVEEFSGSMMGMAFTGRGMMGYDNVSGKYWSTWTDSMSTGLMVSDGTCDDGGKKCTFTGSFNDPVRGDMTVRMVATWTSPTTETFEMYGPGPDGKEMKMMEILYTKR